MFTLLDYLLICYSLYIMGTWPNAVTACLRTPIVKTKVSS